MPRCSGKEGCDLTDRIDLIDRAISSAVNKVSLVNGVPEFHGKKKTRMNIPFMRALWQEKAWRRATLPRATPAVPSPLVYLTSVFGMVTGVTPPLWPPGKSEKLKSRLPRDLCILVIY